jgi:hypothetical protein
MWMRNTWCSMINRETFPGELSKPAYAPVYILHLVLFNRHAIRDCNSKQKIWERMKVFEEFVSLFDCSSV